MCRGWKCESGNASAEMASEASRIGVTEIFRKQDIGELVNYIRYFLQIFSPLACRVLYVEDSVDQRIMLQAQMRDWGMQVSGNVLT